MNDQKWGQQPYFHFFTTPTEFHNRITARITSGYHKLIEQRWIHLHKSQISSARSSIASFAFSRLGTSKSCTWPMEKFSATVARNPPFARHRLAPFDALNKVKTTNKFRQRYTLGKNKFLYLGLQRKKKPFIKVETWFQKPKT